jgi:hypothetical protein
VNAEGRTLVLSPGSTEGFGKLMERVQCKNAVLYYDELAKFVGKAGIENSSIAADLLSFYEGRSVGNVVKKALDAYAFQAGTYCFSWLWCTTDTNFVKLWPRVATADSGLSDRMFFMISPEEAKPAGLHTDPDFNAGAGKTRELIEKAMQQKVYDYADYGTIQDAVAGFDPRSIALIEKLALFFAVDLGRNEIDGDCVERARALVEYRRDVLTFLAPIEAESLQGRIQLSMVRILKANGGKMKYRDFQRHLNYDSYGTDIWVRAEKGMIDSGRIHADFKARPKMMYLVSQDDGEGKS